MALSHSPQIVTRNLLLNLDFGNIQKCYNGSENLLTYSEQFDNAAWGKTNVSISSNTAVAPDGTPTADQVVPTTAGSQLRHISQNYTTSVPQSYTFSVFVKKNTLNSNFLAIRISNHLSTADIFSNFDFSTETFGVAPTTAGWTGNTSVQKFANGWYRLSITANTAPSTHSILVVGIWGGGYQGTSETIGNYLVWGAQLERGQSASPYVPTTVSTITRPTTATSIISNYSHTINRPEYISYDAANNSIRFDRNETFANFTGSITNNVLTVTAMSGINTIRNGAALSYSGISPPRYITSFGTGIGTTGTYNVNSGIDTTSRSMTAAVKISGNTTVTTSGALASNTYLYNDHTTEVWARINDRTAANYDFTEGESVLAVFRGYHSMFLYGSTYLRYYIWDNTGPTGKGTSLLTLGTSGTDIIEGRWFHVAVTKSGTTFRTYLNGVLKYTDTITSTAFNQVSDDLRFGAASDSNTGAYNCHAKNNIGCLKMYNTTLTDDEVRQNFNALRGRFGL